MKGQSNLFNDKVKNYTLFHIATIKSYQKRIIVEEFSGEFFVIFFAGITIFFIMFYLAIKV